MINFDIRKKLRDFPLDVSFQLGNETLVIIGHSGCGKSTTLRAIAGLLTPDEGSITIGDTVVFDKEKKINIVPEERDIGFLFQSYALFPHLSVFENVAYGLQIRKVSKQEQRKIVEKQLENLNIHQYIDNMPDELSGGQQQRVALARALVLNPKVLLLDEPLSALDVTTRDRVRRELKKTLAQLNIPAIVVTHDYEDAISLGDRILVMDRGKVIQEGNATELIVQPKSSFVADFSGANYFEATFQTVQNGRYQYATLQSNQLLRSDVKIDNEKVALLIQPWDIHLSKEKPTDLDVNVIVSTVSRVLCYGNRLKVDLEGELPLSVEVIPSAAGHLPQLKEGDQVFAMIDQKNVKVLEQTG